MKHITIVLWIICLPFCINAQNKVQQLDTSQILAAKGMVGRLLPRYADKIKFEVIEKDNNKDVFELETVNNKLVIRGNSGNVMTSALNYYLKNYCNSSVSWYGDNLSNLPQQLPALPKKIRVATNYKYCYYLNYCTHSYSMAFWDWKRWEREIDWMAMNGINMPLAIVGTEAVWQKVMQRFNFTAKEIKDFIPNTAFAAWWLMQNLEGWGGPMSQEYINSRVELQKKIVGRMRELGMTPVFQGFYGMVPFAMKAKRPDVKIYNTGTWAGGFQRPAQLDPTEPLFEEMAAAWYEEMDKLYGKTNFYGGDPFHEGGVPAGIDLAEAGKGIQNAMLKYNPDASWVLQAWGENPRPQMLSKLVKERTVILDLSGERYRCWQKRNDTSYPWIYNVIVNYGGKLGMYGSLDKVIADLNGYMKNAPERNLQGVGIVPEGIDNNPIAYDMIFDFVWRTQPITLDEWTKHYVRYRYGKLIPEADKAWKILVNTAYSCHREQEGCTESIFCARPAQSIANVSSWSNAPSVYYNPAEFNQAWVQLIKCADKLKDCETFRYDLVDVTRQVLADYGRLVHTDMMAAYKAKNLVEFKKQSAVFLGLIDDQNRLMGTLKTFLLGNWIQSARNLGTTEAEKKQMEYNARVQLTTWSKGDTNLHEYAHKEWNGLLGGLYKQRWTAFVKDLEARLKNQTPVSPDYYAMEKKWCESTTEKYPAQTSGDPVKVAKEIYNKYIRLTYKTLK